MNRKQFENMSLYTLASLYIDTYKDYKNRIIENYSKKLNFSILDYVINQRHDEDLFFDMVKSMLKIRNIEN